MEKEIQLICQEKLKLIHNKCTNKIKNTERKKENSYKGNE